MSSLMSIWEMCISRWGEFEKAEQAYQKTLEINPYYLFGSLSLARLYLQTNRPDQAVGRPAESEDMVASGF